MKRGMCLVLLVGLAFSCSKNNDVDVNNGSLPTGSACEAGIDDPCAGACIASVCRASCGTNRECPSNQTCVGDGDRAGCVDASFGSLDLLSDCADGCSVELPEFGREGTFYSCDTGYAEIPQTTEELIAFGRPDINPSIACEALRYPVFSVKGRYAWQMYDCNLLGAVGEARVLHPFSCPGELPYQFQPSMSVGWGYESGGDSYWLTGVYGEVQLLKFQPESVGDVPDVCISQSTSCEQPSYPAIGGLLEGMDGFWAKCPATGTTGPNGVETFDAAACAQLTWGDEGFRWDPSEGRALYVRPDGFGVRGFSYFLHRNECLSAFRQGAGSDEVVSMNYWGPTLNTRIDFWQKVEQDGETMLEVREYANGPPIVFRKVAIPPEFSDPCDSFIPPFGY